MLHSKILKPTGASCSVRPSRATAVVCKASLANMAQRAAGVSAALLLAASPALATPLAAEYDANQSYEAELQALIKSRTGKDLPEAPPVKEAPKPKANFFTAVTEEPARALEESYEEPPRPAPVAVTQSAPTKSVIQVRGSPAPATAPAEGNTNALLAIGALVVVGGAAAAANGNQQNENTAAASTTTPASSPAAPSGGDSVPPNVSNASVSDSTM